MSAKQAPQLKRSTRRNPNTRRLIKIASLGLAGLIAGLLSA